MPGIFGYSEPFRLKTSSILLPYRQLQYVVIIYHRVDMADQNNVKEAIFIAIDLAPLIFFALSAVITGTIVFFQRRQWRGIRQKIELKAQLVQAILLERIDLQNNLLKQINRELHDRPGQLLFVAKINLNILEEKEQPADSLHYITTANNLLTQTIDELRVSMRHLEEISVHQDSLVQGVRHELDKIRNKAQTDTRVIVNGKPYRLLNEQEIVLLTVVRDILGLVMKHKEPDGIRVTFGFERGKFRLSIGIDHRNCGNCEHATSHVTLLNQLINKCRLIDFDCRVDPTDGHNTTFHFYALHRQTTFSLQRLY